MMISYALMNVFIFFALKRIEASEFTIIFVTSGLWRVLGAVLFLGEKFTIQEIFGTIFVMLAVIVVFYQKKKIKINAGMLFALLGALSFGVAFTNDAYLINHFDVLSYEAFAFFLPAIATAFIFPQKLKKLPSMLQPVYLYKLTFLALIYGISAITIFFAYKLGHNAAQMGAIYQTSTILTVILSIIFLKETAYLIRKFIGIILAFIGIILIG